MRVNWRRAFGWALVGILGVTLGAARAEANGHLMRALGLTPTGYFEPVPTSVLVSDGLVPTTYGLAEPAAYLPTSYNLSPSYGYLAPTAFAVPTTYLAPTSYAVPTALAYPTTYAYPTAYSLPTVTATQTYVRRRFYRRRSYVLASTVASYPVVYATAAVVAYPSMVDPCCVTAAAAPMTAATSRSVVRMPTASKSSEPAGERSGGTADRMPEVGVDAEPQAATVVKPRGTPPASPTPPRGTAAGDAGEPPAPAQPAEEAETPTLLSNPQPLRTLDSSVKPEEPKAPVGPAVDPATLLPPVAPAGGEKPKVRNSFKPVGPANYVRSSREGNLGLLQGRILNGDDARPEEGVEVSFSNKVGTFADRVGRTDPSGRFRVRLPDGDWSVRVTTLGGRVYTVSELTVSNGQITDDLGRDIPTLRITR